MSEGIIEKAMESIANIQLNFPVLIVIALIVFTLIMLPGAMLSRMDNDNENFLPEKDPIVDAMGKVSQDFAGAQSMDFLIMIDDSNPNNDITDIRDPKVLASVDRFVNYLERLEYVARMDSITTEIKNLNNGYMPQEIEKIKEIIRSKESLKVNFSKDFKILKITMRLDSLDESQDTSNKTYKEIKNIIQTTNFPKGVIVKDWGFLTQMREVDANMNSTMISTTLLGFFFIFILVLIFYRSLLSGFLALTPIIVSLLWTVGTMGYIDLPFTVLTTSMIPLVMGMGVDFSIHIMHHIKNHLKRNENIETAVIETMKETGTSLSGSTITTMLGFMSLMLASLLVTQRMGLTLAIAIIYVFLACILIVPTSMILKERVSHFLFKEGIKNE